MQLMKQGHMQSSIADDEFCPLKGPVNFRGLQHQVHVKLLNLERSYRLSVIEWYIT